MDRMRTSTTTDFRSTISGYSTLKTRSESINASEESVKYALYPVYLLNTTWKDKNYLFAMNGQTGKFVGDLPMDKAKYGKYFAAIAAGVAAASFLIQFLFLR
jgi:hypothetical protein